MKREIENRNGFSSLLLNGLKEIWSHNGDVGLLSQAYREESRNLDGFIVLRGLVSNN